MEQIGIAVNFWIFAGEVPGSTLLHDTEYFDRCLS
jgi:hypothetical protein